jgi:4-hydroxybenzoate polyprenyltransferase
MPSIAFGIFNALSGPVLYVQPPSFSQIATRSPLVLVWAWTNLLLLCLNNQIAPESIEEDRLNKAWRPLPSTRITIREAKQLMLGVIPLIIVLSASIGGVVQSLTLMVLNVWYNDWGGAENPVFRNLINAIGFICYASAALDIFLGKSSPSSGPLMLQWFGIIGASVFSTIHIQDLRDQAGDRIRGRPTLPLIIGDWYCRWTLAVPIFFWSLFCPGFWQLEIWGYVVPTVTGGLIGARLLNKRTVKQDKMTFKIWSLWLVSIYLLPFVRRCCEDASSRRILTG